MFSSSIDYGNVFGHMRNGMSLHFGMTMNLFFFWMMRGKQRWKQIDQQFQQKGNIQPRRMIDCLFVSFSECIPIPSTAYITEFNMPTWSAPCQWTD